MKRSWFQIHLSTAIVLMFVAGGLIGLNLQRTVTQWPHLPPEQWSWSYGWPIEFHDEPDYSLINPAQCMINFFAWILILAGTIFTSEHLIRRRDRSRA